ncbi:MAG: CcmD family protein [Chloroflexi bacterium]|nr:CcmD family protein [Chloroflexota bacterium]MCI0578350.1 CcmD family protein [Chloroflexota bacterium]MCI0646247.1 CcmD family protein [Chloroflexota bacterium]MCI0732133.1 CcmD family protein [Chloroflexota bacterium]
MISIFYLLDIVQQTSVDPNKFNNFMVLGYVVLWLVFMIYVFSLANRQRNLHQEIKLMQRLLKEDEESKEA